MARRQFTVLQWLNTVTSSAPIETVICYGANTVCKGPTPVWLACHGPVGPLEAKVRFVSITQERITIHAKPKDTTI